jgi:hypothetical protein
MKSQEVRLATDSFSQHNPSSNRHLIEGPLDWVWRLVGRDTWHTYNSAEGSLPSEGNRYSASRENAWIFWNPKEY